MTDNDMDIVLFCLEQQYESLIKHYRKSGDWLMPNGPRPSDEMYKMLKRLGQLILILKGRGSEIGKAGYKVTRQEY